MKKAIFTPSQGPRSKIMSEKNQGQKSCVSVPLTTEALPNFNNFEQISQLWIFCFQNHFKSNSIKNLHN